MFDLQYGEGRHYYNATRRDEKDLVAAKSTEEFKKMLPDFYAGKVSSEELDSYFEKCCTSMRTYRTGQHQTSGTNEADNTQIVSEMYEVFAKENAMTPMRH